MRKIISILSLFAMVALCATPFFFPDDAEAKQPTTIHASDLEATDKGINYDSLPDGGTATDSAAEAAAQGESTNAEASDPVAPDDEAPTLWQRIFAYLRENTAEGIMAIMMIGQIIVNLTPTEKDNGWFLWLRKIFELIFPNRKAGGGTFEANPKA
jgi:hypothetical protein